MRIKIQERALRVPLLLSLLSEFSISLMVVFLAWKLGYILEESEFKPMVLQSCKVSNKAFSNAGGLRVRVEPRRRSQHTTHNLETQLKKPSCTRNHKRDKYLTAMHFLKTKLV
jgi:hypothetical protein